jgi:hypothetical protein
MELRASEYFERGLAHLLLSQGEPAVRDLHRAIQLDDRHCLARYWYARALRSVGRVRAAVLAARELERILERLPIDAPLEDGTTTAAELLASTRALADDLS